MRRLAAQGSGVANFPSNVLPPLPSLLAPSARAQANDMAHMDRATEADTSAKRPTEMASPLGIPLERTGSGTSWLPDAAPMRALHLRAGDWTFMTHGAVYGMY